VLIQRSDTDALNTSSAELFATVVPTQTLEFAGKCTWRVTRQISMLEETNSVTLREFLSS
jgi:hypothetical protein